MRRALKLKPTNEPTSFDKSFCPILRDKCREDCDWLHEIVFLNDDGITKNNYCAVNMIANSLFELTEPDE